MGFERNSFEIVIENIIEVENSILFDDFNKILINKLVVIFVRCGDKGIGVCGCFFWYVNW